MNPKEYQELAMKTEADQHAIRRRIMANRHSKMTRLDNAVRGLSGDVGEVATCVQKYIEYGQELDEINLKEEVGDCLWRLAQICKAIEITLEDAMIANIEKLKIRYPDKYSDERAAEKGRDRKAERNALRDLSGANLEQNGHGWGELPEEKIVCEECRTSYLKCCAPCLEILINDKQ